MPTYSLISTTTISSPASSVTISSIPATYDTLVLRYLVKSAATNTLCQLYVRPNNDSNTNYYRNKQIYWTGTTTAGIDQNGSTDNTAFMGYIGSSGNNSQAGIGIAYFYNYADNTQFTSIMCDSTQIQKGYTSHYTKTQQSLYKQTGVVSSLYLYESAGNLLSTGSVFRLYGIKYT